MLRALFSFLRRDDEQDAPDRVITPLHDRFNFENALTFTLKEEGGKVDDPDDRGGRTNQGVTQRAYDTYRAAKSQPSRDVWLISATEIEDLYYTYYWLEGGCDKLKWPMALAHFDTCVQFGPWRAQALFLARTSDPSSYIEYRRNYHRARVKVKPSQVKYLKGWLARCDRLEAACSPSSDSSTATA